MAEALGAAGVTEAWSYRAVLALFVKQTLLTIHRSPLAALLVVLETKHSCSELRIYSMASLSLLPWERARRVKFPYYLPVLPIIYDV